MFKLHNGEPYYWPVEIKLPKNGKFETHTFDVLFKFMPESEFQALRADIRDDKITSDVEVAKGVVLGWRGVLDESGKEMPFSISALEQLLEVPGLARAISMTFFETREAAKRKN